MRSSGCRGEFEPTTWRIAPVKAAQTNAEVRMEVTVSVIVERPEWAAYTDYYLSGGLDLPKCEPVPAVADESWNRSLVVPPGPWPRFGACSGRAIEVEFRQDRFDFRLLVAGVLSERGNRLSDAARDLL